MSPKGKMSLANRILVESPWANEYFSRPCQRLWGVVRGVTVVPVVVPVFVVLLSAVPPPMAIGRTMAKPDCSI